MQRCILPLFFYFTVYLSVNFIVFFFWFKMSFDAVTTTKKRKERNCQTYNSGSFRIAEKTSFVFNVKVLHLIFSEFRCVVILIVKLHANRIHKATFNFKNNNESQKQQFNWYLQYGQDYV